MLAEHLIRMSQADFGPEPETKYAWLRGWLIKIWPYAWIVLIATGIAVGAWWVWLA